MEIKFEQYTEAGQRTITSEATQYILVHKETKTTAARSEMMGFQYSWRATFTSNHSVQFAAVICSVPCAVVVNGKIVTVHVARGTAVPVTVYCFTSITSVNPAPSTTGYGLEMFTEDGKLKYSSMYSHLRIRAVASVYHSVQSTAMEAISNVALCVSDYPTNHFYGAYTPEGYWVENVLRGYMYNTTSGAITSANISLSRSQEFSRPIVVGYGYYLSLMLVDVSLINAKYPSTFIMAA